MPYFGVLIGSYALRLGEASVLRGEYAFWKPPSRGVRVFTDGSCSARMSLRGETGASLLCAMLSTLNKEKIAWGDPPQAEVHDALLRFGYVLERATESLGVTYFVADTFELRHRDAATLRQLEERVEADTLQRLRRRCQAERASKQRMLEAVNAQPQGADKSRMFEAMDAYDMRWCEEKDRLEAKQAAR